jgi:hypothetical protein
MPTDRELRVNQRQKLYMLLAIERDPDELNRQKKQLIAEMDDEDIAVVQKTVENERN